MESSVSLVESSLLSEPSLLNSADGLRTLFHVERSYYRSAIRAYNMTRYVVESLSFDSTVIATSMVYWHTFVCKHGLRKIDEIVLSASCVFLASKVEHYKVRLNKVIALVFEINLRSEEVEGWRRMLLETELLLCHTLGFSFQVTHPMKRIAEMVPQNDQAVFECAHRLFHLSFVTPLCTRVSTDEVAEALVYLAADGANRLDTLAGRFTCTSPERRDGIICMMIDAMVVMKKTTGFPKIDDAISASRKRFRDKEPSCPLPSRSSAGIASSSETPCVQDVE
ncbi:Cyclin N terminal domain [Trypanosoma vivax]|nr:Cyclin N terminal domain [Trypanosoma vivax]